MKIYDISRELFSTAPYPGDPMSSLEMTSDMVLGDVCSVSMLHLCAHGATHLDAPLHFFEDGGDVSQIPLDRCVGDCVVIESGGIILGDKAEDILGKGFPPRILFKGDVVLSPSAAYVFASSGVRLIGVEKQSVSNAEDALSVHRTLLAEEILLLEGIDLSDVPVGYYYLFAAPIKMAGAEASPVRAVLVEQKT